MLKGRLEVKQYEAWKRVDQGKQKGIKKREDQERNKKGQYSATINKKKKHCAGLQKGRSAVKQYQVLKRDDQGQQRGILKRDDQGKQKGILKREDQERNNIGYQKGKIRDETKFVVQN